MVNNLDEEAAILYTVVSTNELGVVMSGSNLLEKPYVINGHLVLLDNHELMAVTLLVVSD